MSAVDACAADDRGVGLYEVLDCFGGIIAVVAVAGREEVRNASYSSFFLPTA
jgi:hypothetical protein